MQEEVCRKAALAAGASVVEVFRDEGFTGEATMKQAPSVTGGPVTRPRDPEKPPSKEGIHPRDSVQPSNSGCRSFPPPPAALSDRRSHMLMAEMTAALVVPQFFGWTPLFGPLMAAHGAIVDLVHPPQWETILSVTTPRHDTMELYEKQYGSGDQGYLWRWTGPGGAGAPLTGMAGSPSARLGSRESYATHGELRGSK